MLTGTDPLEEVIIHLIVNGPNGSGGNQYGQIQAVLTSPSGTESLLLLANPMADSIFNGSTYKGVAMDVELTSNAFWGEDPTGEWKLTLSHPYPQAGPFDNRYNWTGFEVTTRHGELIPATSCAGHPADFNGDCMVDEADINFLLSCFTGPEGSVSGACQAADINNDGIVDMVDFAILQRCLAPEPALLDPNCVD